MACHLVWEQQRILQSSLYCILSNTNAICPLQGTALVVPLSLQMLSFSCIENTILLHILHPFPSAIVSGESEKCSSTSTIQTHSSVFTRLQLGCAHSGFVRSICAAISTFHHMHGHRSTRMMNLLFMFPSDWLIIFIRCKLCALKPL